MPFYMNPFDQEFRGNLLLGDRHHIPVFIVPPNKNRTADSVAWINGPYDFSTLNILTFNVAIDPTLKQFFSFNVNVAGSNASATQPHEIASLLNADPTFSGHLTALVKQFDDKSRMPLSTVLVSPKRPAQTVRFYLSNTGAEQKMQFNQKAGIAEIPLYFDKHLISNTNFALSEKMLIKLDGTNVNFDLPIIRNFLGDQTWTNANLKADYQLFGGKSGIFNFKKQTVDGSNRVTSIVEYPAGAAIGDFARKTTYSYTAANTVPDIIAEVPYVLIAGDLVTPP